MADGQRCAHEVVVAHGSVVAIDEGRARAAKARASFDQRLEQRLLGTQYVECKKILTRHRSDASESQMFSP
jgi:hypothetical protein